MSNTFSPRPYESLQSPLLHSGVVLTSASTGQVLVDLGIGHNNFVPALNLQGDMTAAELGLDLAWKYGSSPGQFLISVANGGSPDSTARSISFVAVVGSSVSQ
jgi:hypothetical protein